MLRDMFFEIRLHTREKEIIEAQAKHCGLTVSEYMRRRLLKNRVVSTVHEDVINELRRLGALEKKLISELPESREELNKVLEELLQTIRRLG